MRAVWLLARPELRRRWLSWVALGLLAGGSVGLAAAGIAGARRTERALPAYDRAAHIPDAAVLPNDPTFGPEQRRAIARLPEVRTTLPFMVAVALETADPKGLQAGGLPVAPRSTPTLAGVIVAGRLPDPRRADEIVVNERLRDKYHLDLGSTITLRQPDPHGYPGIPPQFVPANAGPLRQRLRIVGISDSPNNAIDSMPSAGFYAKYHDRLVGIVNEFVVLRRGQRDLPRFQDDVARILGHPVNVPPASELFGTSQLGAVSDLERAGLLLFALAVLVGAGALVGQALVRAVTAGGAELDTWRALGVDRPLAVRTLTLPTFVTAAVGAVTSVVVAIALSPRFPIALTRNYDLDIGFHADWPVLTLAAGALVVTVLGAAWVTAELTLLRRNGREVRPAAGWHAAASNALPPSLQIGSRLAVEPGRGRRAVPVRSAFVGAAAGVLGVVACFTFRAGLTDAVHDPQRSGVVWDQFAAGVGGVAPADVQRIAHVDGVAAVLDAQWARAARINGRPTATWGTRAVVGRIPLVVTSGRAPERIDELALARATMDQLGLHVGDRVRAGVGRGTPMRVVGEALLPPSSHTQYDQGAWMTLAGLRNVVPASQLDAPDFVEDWLLIRDRQGTDHAAVQHRVFAIADPKGYFTGRADLPTSVVSLGQLRALPLALAGFFALLAIATVAHALVTTVRRRRHDLAVLRTLGFTRRDVRIAIAWQSTLIAAVGIVVGVPLGVITGRVVWRQLALSFPVVYASPLAVAAVLVVIPLALVVANLLAAGPAHAATRVQPAAVLRTE